MDELTFGEYEYFKINVKDLVILPQIRKTKNEIADELIESIKNTDLINLPDVVKLTPDELYKHINFINRLWKKKISIKPFKMIDGHYYVVIAGHTRVDALKEIAKRQNCNVNVWVKIHKTNNSKEILAKQIAENYHSKPKIEERSVAIIEYYKLGLKDGDWSNKTEFVKQNASINKDLLYDAVSFANLPVEIQKYVFEKNVPYAIAIALGRMYDLIKRVEEDKLDSSISLDNAIKEHYIKLVAMIQKNKKNKKSIQSNLDMLSAYKETLKDHFKPKEEMQQIMLDELLGAPDRQYEVREQQIRDEHRNVKMALNRVPFKLYQEFLYLDTEITGIDNQEQITDIEHLYNQHIKRHFISKD